MNINEDLENSCAIYIAHKNDQVDRKLANYLNSFPERKKLSIMFLRETEGVYKFGSKRVYIKISQQDNLQVRVGGGYMHIDNFIEQYT